MRLIFSAFFFILSSFQIFAQESKNPFEIRTTTKDSMPLGITNTESSDLRGLVNPFELRPSLYVKDSSDTQVAKIKRLLLPKNRSGINPDSGRQKFVVLVVALSHFSTCNCHQSQSQYHFTDVQKPV
ncbi:MAG: hypothetical protein IPK61_16905 [Saprospiraceae bacterium]|nr:hypothetical protein [Saprospiraceae bacterium]